MGRATLQQNALFPALAGVFPSTRYQGSKVKVADWIWKQVADLDFATCLDAFGGTGVIAYRFKQAGKQVAYNDLLRFNYYFGQALVENDSIKLHHEQVDRLLGRQADIVYPRVIQDNFSDIYFTDEENAWIDRTITNIRQLSDPYEFAIAFYALCQACIIKRPYNLFHRKNLYIRLADVERSFGNKTTWDQPFEQLFRNFVAEANRAVFDNGSRNVASNYDAVDVPGDYDLIYVDTPYISTRGTPVDYFGFYHFLEGLTMYDDWCKHIDFASKHHRLNPRPDKWADKKRIHSAFDELFKRFQNSIIVVSYRSDGIPSVSELSSLLGQYKNNVQLEHFGQYQYVLSTNSESEEILLIGT